MQRLPQEVFVVKPVDYDQLAEFLRDFPGFQQRTKEFWVDRLRYWWELNPAFSESFSRGWILRNNDQIVGFFGSIPLKLLLSGKETTVFAGTTWRVLPSFRGMSMALKSRQMEEHKEVLHMSARTRQEVIPLLKLLRYQPIHRSSNQQSMLIVDFSPVLRAKFKKLGGTALAKILAPGPWMLQAFRTRRIKQLADHKVKIVDKADASFDALWERTRNCYANTNVRSAAVINWYCFGIDELKKTLLGYYEGNQLLGYMMLVRDESPAVKALDCLDLWLDPEGPVEKVLASLVAKAADYAKENGLDRVVFAHFNEHLALLYSKLGLIQRPVWKQNEFFKGPAHIVENIRPENSYFVVAQGDVGL